MKSISFILPCYNESKNLARVAMAIRDLCCKDWDEHEVIIVNDGSTDTTQEVAVRLARQYPSVRVIHHDTNRGYGAALRSGYYAAKNEWVCLFPGDGQFDIREIERFLPLTDEYDVINGYRQKRADPPHRLLNAFLYKMLIRILFGIKLRDLDCGFKLIRRRLFNDIRLSSNGAFIDAEFFVLARALGCRIGEVGVTHYPREHGAPTGARLAVILRMFKELWEFRKCMKKEVAALLACKAQK